MIAAISGLFVSKENVSVVWDIAAMDINVQKVSLAVIIYLFIYLQICQYKNITKTLQRHYKHITKTLQRHYKTLQRHYKLT